jgi:putative ABC transport system permease protein
MRLVRLLALRHLRLRPLRALLAIAAVAAGCAMAVSVLVVRTSIAASVDSYGRALSGPTELRVVGPTREGGLDPSVVDEVAAVDGVDAVIPMVQAYALTDVIASGDELDGVWRTTVLGVDCRVEALVGDVGCTPEALAAVGDDPLGRGPAAIGRDVGDTELRLRTHEGSVPIPGEVPVIRSLGELGDQPVLVYGLGAAQEMFGRGDRLDVVYVDVAPGADVAAVEAALTDVVGEHNGVLDATEGPPEVTITLQNVLPMFTLMALFALGIGAMLVHNTAELSIAERRRDLAVVSALGGTSRTIASASLGEAAVVGSFGGVLGALGGAAVAGPIVGSFEGYTRRIAGMGLEVHVTWTSVLVSIALGVVVSVAAAAFPVRRALRVDVAAELSGRGDADDAAPPVVRRRALLWGLACVASAAAVFVGTRNAGLAPWQASVGTLGFAASTVTTVLFGVQVAPLAVRRLERLAERSAPARLAVANLVREPRRTGVMVAAVGAATTTAFITAGYVEGVETSISAGIERHLDGVEVHTTTSAGDTGITPAWLELMASAPGVADVHQGASVTAGTRPGDLMTVFAYEDVWFDRSPVRGSYDAERFAAGEAIASAGLARSTGLRPGDVARLPTPAGMAEVPVQAIVQNGGQGGQSVQIPFDLHQDLYGVRPSQEIVVEPSPGTSYEELQRNLEDAFDEAGLEGRLRADTPRQAADSAAANVGGQLAAFWTLQRGLLVVSFVAVLSTLLLVGIQRRREMGLLGAVGMEPRMLSRMVVAEAGIVGLVAMAFTAPAGFVLLWALNRMAPLIVGWSNPLRPDWSALVIWGTVSLVVAVAASLWPARRAARTNVIEALQVD